MIRTQEEYNNACNFIDSDMELYDFQLSEKMSSYEYNLYLQDTEYFLNFLYEKIRILEELSEYLDHYVDVKIQNVRKELEEKLHVIETVGSSYMAKEKEAAMPVWNTAIPVTDRDGSTIHIADTTEHIISGASKKTNIIVPISIQRKEGTVPYADSLSDFLKTGSYFSRYKEMQTEEIVEVLYIMLPDQAKFNCVSYHPINANITMQLVNNNQICLTIKPLHYNKEQSSFDYADYAKIHEINLFPDHYSYVPYSSVTDNINNSIMSYNDRKRIDYKFRICAVQHNVEQNNQKSDIISNM